MSKKLLILLLALSTAISGCSFTKPTSQLDFGPAYNAEREKIDLPLIPPDWSQDPASTTTESTWYAPNWKNDYKARKPIHDSKYVYVEANQIVYETDHYFGSKDWNCEGSTCRESLVITYCYQANSQCGGNVGWYAIYQTEATIGPGKEFIMIDDAKKILNEWGLSYP